MSHTAVDIRTVDGVCPTHVFAPDRDGRWPGVIMFMDAYGVRPAFYQMAQRLADSGYLVLLPDLYYRTGFTVPEGKSLFGDAEVRDDWKARVVPTVGVVPIMRDMPAWLDYIDSHADVAGGKIGAVGYCMGGKLALAAAGYFPERVVAAASYHGGGLATDAPDSVHLLAPQMKARVYVGGAKDDSGFDDAQKARLEKALSDAGVDHRVETYNARHGWVPSDMPVHDHAEAEHHWLTLLELFDTTLHDPVAS
jgi:carboxymethylenebutenolidase